MASWHKRARLGVAIFGLAVAGIVYAALGERRVPGPRAAVQRIDPKAVSETLGGVLERIVGVERQFVIEADVTQTYDDGSTKWTGVRRIAVRRGDKDFVATAGEARAGPDSKELELTGDVKLTVSDGLELLTESATYNSDDGVARTPDAVTFTKGRMSGSGTGMSWDQDAEVLTIQNEARIVTRDEAGNVATELAAAFATLDRLQDLLLLNDGAHVVRGGQVIDARSAVARLSPNEDAVTFINLMGDARVTGAGSGIDAMSARDMDLDYTDDGATLEAVELRGGSAVAMTGQNGAAGRQFLGETLSIGFHPDGALRGVVGKDQVQLDLPAAGETAARSIRAASMNAQGQAGKGLTDATFSGDVSFTEEAAKGAGRRTAHSQELRVSLENDAVTSATFTGRAGFEEQGLLASAAKVDYQPDKGILSLSGSEGNVLPCVADDRVTIDAQAIDVTLQGHTFTANGAVKTTMRGDAKDGKAATCGGRSVAAADRPAGDAARLPGLLDQKASAVITADSLDYRGTAGNVVYKGTAKTPARMVQGATVIRAITLAIDQAAGDLVATGAVVANIALDNELTTARAEELRYVDAKRLITLSVPTAAARGRGAAPAVPVAPVPSVDLRLGPRGDLTAGRVVLALVKTESKLERLDAETNVALTLPGKSLVTGATRMTYDAAADKYEFHATALNPVVWLYKDKDSNECRENSGTTLTTTGSDSASATLATQGERRFQTLSKPCPASLR